MTFHDPLEPDRRRFDADPFSYSALAWYKWGAAQAAAGIPTDPSKRPTREDLKSPILWFSQAHALVEAAMGVLRSRPEWQQVPQPMRSMCDSQHCAVGLMLVGYSLEICLKGMLILRKGVEVYQAEEKKHQHHRLEELAEFIPGLEEKDLAILRLLTHFVLWAGRYPDPGKGRDEHLEEIFQNAEKHQICARDLFVVAGRVMSYSQQVVDDWRPV